MIKLEAQIALEIKSQAEQNGYHIRNNNRKLNAKLVAHILKMKGPYTFIHNNWQKIICGIFEAELIVVLCIYFNSITWYYKDFHATV